MDWLVVVVVVVRMRYHASACRHVGIECTRVDGDVRVRSEMRAVKLFFLYARRLAFV